MDDLSKKKVRFYDYGLFVSLARKVSQSFGSGEYFRPWKSAFPYSRPCFVGEGYPEMARVKHFFKDIDKPDLFVFTDVLDADLQVDLVSRGKRVWGSRWGEQLELNRITLRQKMKEIGLPTSRADIVIGISALREYLKKYDNIYVKINTFRGDMETWKSETYDLSEPRLDKIEHDFSERKELVPFICEHGIEDAVEGGIDTYVIDGQFPEVALLGFEIKGVGLVGVVKEYKDMPEPILEVNRKLAPLLKDYQYRGFFSTEVRITKDGTPYLIDPCCRCPSPPSELYQELYVNLAEILWEGADGKMVTPEISAICGVQANIYEDRASKESIAVLVDGDADQWVKLRNCCRINGIDYVLPLEIGLDNIGAVVGVGDTVIEAVGDCKAHAELVHPSNMDIHLDALGKAIAEIEELQEFGIEVVEEPLPDLEEIADA